MPSFFGCNERVGLNIYACAEAFAGLNIYSFAYAQECKFVSRRRRAWISHIPLCPLLRQRPLPKKTPPWNYASISHRGIIFYACLAVQDRGICLIRRIKHIKKLNQTTGHRQCRLDNDNQQEILRQVEDDF